jgi:hypothetical protein
MADVFDEVAKDVPKTAPAQAAKPEGDIFDQIAKEQSKPGYKGETTSTGIAAPQGTASGSGRSILRGIAEGAANTTGGLLSTTARAIHHIPVIGETLAPEVGIRAIEARTAERSKPANTAEAIGKGAEQGAEFLIPGGAEEKMGILAGKALPGAAKLAVPIARAATSALTTGALNKVQGGDFGTGATVGGVGGILGEAGRAVAPKIAESAIRIPAKEKGFDRAIGESVLENTRGIRPATIAKQAGEKSRALTGTLEANAKAATGQASMTPAISVIDDEIAKATKRNSGTVIGQLNSLKDQLTKRVGTGAPIPANVSAEEILNLKRGINDLISSWTSEQKAGIRPVIKRVYSALDKELDRVVPASEGLNRQISSLIPASKAAAKTANAPGIIRSIMRPTGVATARTLIGAGAGYRHGGADEAVLGGLLGMLGPEIAFSPEGQMLGARLANSRIPVSILKAATLQGKKAIETGESEEKP